MFKALAFIFLFYCLQLIQEVRATLIESQPGQPHSEISTDSFYKKKALQKNLQKIKNKTSQTQSESITQDQTESYFPRTLVHPKGSETEVEMGDAPLNLSELTLRANTHVLTSRIHPRVLRWKNLQKFTNRKKIITAVRSFDRTHDHYRHLEDQEAYDQFMTHSLIDVMRIYEIESQSPNLPRHYTEYINREGRRTISFPAILRDRSEDSKPTLGAIIVVFSQQRLEETQIIHTQFTKTTRTRGSDPFLASNLSFLSHSDPPHLQAEEWGATDRDGFTEVSIVSFYTANPLHKNGSLTMKINTLHFEVELLPVQ